MSYYHKLNISHRDIKLENFLIGSDINDIKLIDFGLSIEYNLKKKPRDICGTFIT